jgi:hypothetical protein
MGCSSVGETSWAGRVCTGAHFVHHNALFASTEAMPETIVRTGHRQVARRILHY